MGSVMRFSGAVLLIGGFLLCVSIVWAAIGFLMMGFGLICLLIAERRNKRLAISSGISGPRQALSPNPEPSLALVPADQSSDRRSNATGPSSYDEVRWNSLVESDPDLLRLVAILTRYGQKYVDELATAYLALNDKEYLPMILKKIVTSARRDAGQDVTSELKVYSNPNASRRRPQVNRVRALQAVYDVVVDDPAVVHLLPQRDTKQSRLPAQAQPKLSGGRPDSGTGSGRKLAREDAEAEIAAVAPDATEAASLVGLDDADNNDLAELLNSFVLQGPSDKTRP